MKILNEFTVIATSICWISKCKNIRSILFTCGLLDEPIFHYFTQITEMLREADINGDGKTDYDG